jgi:hypothetical protein
MRGSAGQRHVPSQTAVSGGRLPAAKGPLASSHHTCPPSLTRLPGLDDSLNLTRRGFYPERNPLVLY